MGIVADTGPLYALADRDDAAHARCLALNSETRGAWMVPSSVVVETCLLMESRLGPASEAGFLDAVAKGELTMVDLSAEDLRRMAELIRQYSDFPLGAVDASVVATAERLNVDTLITLDRRHFGAVRPRHVESFKLLP